MKKSTNIIYLDEYGDRFDYQHQRHVILALAENKFSSRNKAEEWITTPHPVINIEPQALLGSPLGYRVIADMLRYENTRWTTQRDYQRHD